MDAKYWDMVDNVVDVAALLTEDKPVAKVIIGTIDTIVESQGTGVTNTDIKEVITNMAKSKWNDIKETDLSEITAIIGEDIELDLKTDKSEKDTGWLGKLWSGLTVVLGFAKQFVTNPAILKVIGYVETIVAAKDVGISNDAVKNTLVSMAKSTWNNLDSAKINKIMKVVGKQ